MKELSKLSIKEKAKRYDEAIERAHKLKEDPTSVFHEYSPSEGDTVADYIFPELKKSEDERIRKAIYNCVEWFGFDSRFFRYASQKDCLAWIKKQGEQDNNEDSNILQRFSFYSYKDEPNILYLSGLYVNEECRNKGIGTKILEVADEVAKNLNCHTIRLKTKKDSDAERLYRTHGYNSLTTEDSDEIWLEKQEDNIQNPITFNNDHIINSALNDYCCKQYSALHKENGGVLSFARLQHLAMDIYDWCKKQYEQKPTDNVKPMFMVGDWIVSNVSHKYYRICKILNDDGEYIIESIDGYRGHNNFETIDKDYHIWTIQDAKDGDILRIKNLTFIFKEITNNNACHKDAAVAYCSYEDNDDNFGISGPDCITDLDLITPATKEQHHLLFQKMHVAGYVWYADKKKLKETEQNHTDKVKPKFEIGDFITNGVLVGKIDKIHELGYHAYFGDHYADVPNIENWHKWTIKDAKDGDVLVTDNGLAFIYNGYLEEQQWPFAYGGINIYGKFNICDGLLPFTHQKIVPATKEQRDLLFQKMKEAGYEWDVEKKELKIIDWSKHIKYDPNSPSITN